MRFNPFARKRPETEPSYEKCVADGIQYFKDIGSWPELSTGENAEAKVKARCARSRWAFEPLSKSGSN